MAWFILARALFVSCGRLLGVSAAAPRRRRSRSNVAFGVVLGALDRRRSRCGSRTRRVTHVLGALLGGAIGLAARQGARRRAVLGQSRRRPRRLPAQPHPARAAVSRPGDGRAQRRVARARESHQPVPRRRPAPALQGARHQRHHRRPHRRHLRNRIRGRHAGHPAVRAERAAAGRRLVGLDEAQPRPPRPRHPAEDSEDGRRRRAGVRRRLSRISAKST